MAQPLPGQKWALDGVVAELRPGAPASRFPQQGLPALGASPLAFVGFPPGQVSCVQAGKSRSGPGRDGENSPAGSGSLEGRRPGVFSECVQEGFLSPRRAWAPAQLPFLGLDRSLTV